MNNENVSGQVVRNGQVHQDLGFSYFEQRQIEKAIEEFNQALKLNVENEHVHFGLGLCYHQKEEYEKAIEEFNKVLRINLQHPQVKYHLELCHMQLGNAYFDKKKYPEAIIQFTRALELNPQNVDSYENLGFCYFEQRSVEEALAKFNQTLKLNFKNEHVHFGLGLCYYQKKEYNKAIEEFRQTLKINPNNEYAHQDLGFCYFWQEHIEKAIEEFSQAIKINPRNEHAAHGLGCAYLHQRRYDLAQKAFNKAIEINANFTSAHQGLGTLYLEQRLYDLAEEEFKKGLEFDSDNIFFYQMLGYIHKRQGKHELAVNEFIKATGLYLTMEAASKKFINSTENKNISLIDNKGKFAVKILRMPSFCNQDEILSTELNTSILPPLALGQITAHLRANGIKIDQDDLNIKIYYDNYYLKMPDKEIDTSIFLDENRISRYISGDNDNDLESIMKKLEEKTSFYGYNVVLLSIPVIISNSSCLMFTLSLARFLKKKYNPILILGGAKQSIDLLKKYDCKNIDLVIYGEGEAVLCNLLLALKNNIALTESLNSLIKQDGRLVSTDTHPPIKPDFSGLPMDMYKYKGLNANYNGASREILEEFNKSETLLLPFKFIKGCPYECIFCASSIDKSMYVLEPVTVVLYLKELQKEYKPTGFFFLSDTINISQQYIKGLCDEIIRSDIRILWSDCARADNLDRDVLFKMRKAGCIRLIFGMETASLKLLNYTNKKISLKGLENVLQWSCEAGIWTGLEVICGLPYEKDNDIEETRSFLNKNKKYINSLYFNQFDLREGSVLLKHPEAFGLENITEINQYAESVRAFATFHKYSYDETNGLKWQDKKIQILNSYKKLLDGIDWNNCLPVYEFEHFLFFLYNKLNDKAKIYDIFTRIAVEKDTSLKEMLLNNKRN